MGQRGGTKDTKDVMGCAMCGLGCGTAAWPLGWRGMAASGGSWHSVGCGVARSGTEWEEDMVCHDTVRCGTRHRVGCGRWHGETHGVGTEWEGAHHGVAMRHTVGRDKVWEVTWQQEHDGT